MERIEHHALFIGQSLFGVEPLNSCANTSVAKKKDLFHCEEYKRFVKVTCLSIIPWTTQYVL